MSTTSSIPKPDLIKGSVISGWTVIRKLGSGGFGAVYEMEKGGERAALKTEYIVEKESEPLRNEVQQLRVLQWSRHFCRLLMAYRIGTDDGQEMNCMLMSLVGRPLSRLRRMTPNRRFTTSSALRLSRLCLQPLEDLHSVGILHRDIKGSNFAWSDERIVYLIDLGFCRRFVCVDDVGVASYRPVRKRGPFLGTAKYCSIHTHARVDQGRRDDLWGWFYMTVEFFKGKLLWTDDEDHEMSGTKQKLGSRVLGGRCPIEMYPIYDHIRDLDILSRPDYAMIRGQIDKACARLGYALDDVFDWEEGGKHYDLFKLKSDTERDNSPTKKTEDPTTSEGEKTYESGSNCGNSEADGCPDLPSVYSSGASSGTTEISR